MADEVTRVRERTSQLLDELDPRTTPVEKFRSRQFDLGLAWVSFPEGYGGLGVPPDVQREVDRRLLEAGATPPGAREFFGLTMAGPTVVTHGSEELRRRILRPTFTGEESWCQLFSEPGAGSDLAGLATRAVPDGDEWVITGQKVWNTLAHIADRGMLVARTDPEAPKHKGLTYFALDMHADGVDVRPLRQMTGEAEFNEVYITEVRVSDADRIGEVGEGWRVAMTTLSNERTTIGGGTGLPVRGSGSIAEALRIWSSDGFRQNPVDRDRLVRLWIEAEVLRITNMRASQNRKAGNPGPEGSIAKLMFAEVNKRIYELCIDLMGADALVGYDYTMRRAEALGLVGPAGSARKMFIRSRANSIEGGTSEIQRNILGERILGLPGDVRVDKELPWSKCPAVDVGGVTDARRFLGLERLGDDLHWRLVVDPELTTPGKFLFGWGRGLGAALVALEAASGRPTVWATAQYLSYAPTHSVLDLEVTLAAEGRRITQGRVVGSVGGREILTVNAAAGSPGDLDVGGVWVTAPEVPPPDQCPPRRLPDFSSTSIFDRIDVRLAQGLSFEEITAGGSGAGDPTSALWARVPGHLEPSAATLAIIGDYVSGGVSQPLGRRVMSRSLDNTLRMVQLEPTEWVLCHIRIQALVNGYGQGFATLWSQNGSLLATASQSMSVRLWDEERVARRMSGG